MASTCPAVTTWPTCTSTSVILPETAKFTSVAWTGVTDPLLLAVSVTVWGPAVMMRDEPLPLPDPLEGKNTSWTIRPAMTRTTTVSSPVHKRGSQMRLRRRGFRTARPPTARLAGIPSGRADCGVVVSVSRTRDVDSSLTCPPCLDERAAGTRWPVSLLGRIPCGHRDRRVAPHFLATSLLTRNRPARLHPGKGGAARHRARFVRSNARKASRQEAVRARYPWRARPRPIVYLRGQ